MYKFFMYMDIYIVKDVIVSITDEDISQTVSLQMHQDDRVCETTQSLRTLLQAKGSDLIFKVKLNE